MKSKTGIARFASVCFLILVSTACQITLLQFPPIGGPTQPSVPVSPSPTPQPRAQTTFAVSIPEPLVGGESIALSILDEVTGLSFNAVTYPMQAKDSFTYTATVALPVNAVIKYRYIRQTSRPILEDTALDAPIRYRLYYVAAQAEVQDILGSWEDKTYTRPTGGIQGRVLNNDTGAPIPSLMVTAGGVQSITDSAGRFDLQGLATGTHNLVVYSLDGTFQPFEQGALVADKLNTTVELKVRAAPLVRVTFNVTAPNDVQGAPVRIAGNLIELGNIFADMKAGINTIADRMPIMALQNDGRYQVTVNLPVGAYVQYKYTLGDGFWNAEHKATGEFALREFIVPAQDIFIQDKVETWQAGNSAPILFEVTVPASTQPGDIVYIQFNPYGWTEPIPMWPLGNNKWAYKLYGPLNMLGTFRYRYCRNGQCGAADDLATAGDSAAGREVATSLVAEDIQDTVANWAWLDRTDPTTLVGAAITARPAGFMTGVEFQSTYQPNWTYYNPQAVQNIQALGANWVIFTPSWTFKRSSPLEFGLNPGQDPFWLDSAIMVSQARGMNLNVALFPIPRFNASPNDFWKNAPRDAAWWQNWFDHYRAFAINYADLAAQSGAQALILGGDWLDPAMPGGLLADGTSSGVPADADARWKAIVAEVRQHFNGKVLWALPYTPGKFQTSLVFLQDTDGVYLLWNAALAKQAGASKEDMTAQAAKLLDNEVSALPLLINKPLIIALAYPSASGAATGCLPAPVPQAQANDGKGGCLDWTALNQPNNPGSVSLDLQAQADIYEVMLNAINTRPWVGGIVSRGYYPPAMLQDKSASVHGKPAADLLWYWFPRLTGVVK
ncbi:MAG: hypothetical protein HYR70_03975 [Chloroflexi bacterium]|nr:hypothetical protein [Chloroflexota bacterium]MBI3340714.1 hypothetical protein [Chloroflexota bacterium]